MQRERKGGLCFDDDDNGEDSFLLSFWRKVQHGARARERERHKGGAQDAEHALLPPPIALQ